MHTVARFWERTSSCIYVRHDANNFEYCLAVEAEVRSASTQPVYANIQRSDLDHEARYKTELYHDVPATT